MSAKAKLKNSFKIKILLAIFSLFSTDLVASDNSSQLVALEPKKMDWKFEDFFGRFDRPSIQRGFQVYQEVCSACHSMKLMSYRNLTKAGFSEDEVKQIAAQYSVIDGPNDEGEMYERKALPSDKFVSPFPNDNAARAANNGVLPIDLSLIIKARPNGANYVYSLIRGFKKAPEHFTLEEDKYYNPYFQGRQISMAPPLEDDEMIEYQDGTYASKEQMTIDVVNFLQFAAEAEMEDRKKMGVKSILFLVSATILFMFAKRRIWKKLKNKY